VFQQRAFPVFSFEGQKVPYPASGLLTDIKLNWRTSHYYQPVLPLLGFFTRFGFFCFFWGSGVFIENRFFLTLVKFL